MTTCHCDGPPHAYNPSWCGVGRGDNGGPIGPQIVVVPAGQTVVIVQGSSR